MNLRMALVTWTERLSVGVKVLDDDHKKLIGILNELHEAVQTGDGRESLGSTLGGLIDYMKVHFAREEHFFQQTKYAAAVAHKKLHDHFAKQVLAVQEKYKAGASSTTSLELMIYLKNWLVTHIQGEDMKYRSHLNSKGIH
jgi:hemerythrin